MTEDPEFPGVKLPEFRGMPPDQRDRMLSAVRFAIRHPEGLGIAAELCRPFDDAWGVAVECYGAAYAAVRRRLGDGDDPAVIKSQVLGAFTLSGRFGDVVCTTIHEGFDDAAAGLPRRYPAPDPE